MNTVIVIPKLDILQGLVLSHVGELKMVFLVTIITVVTQLDAQFC